MTLVKRDGAKTSTVSQVGSMETLTEKDVLVLLGQPESERLDFKRDCALGKGDSGKGEMLKDILAFANTRRNSPAYILYGVEEVNGQGKQVVGLAASVDDASFQELTKRAVNRKVRLTYYQVEVQGKQVGVLEISPEQPRPLYLLNDYGKAREKTVYVRNGSDTAILTPEDAVALRPMSQGKNRGQPLTDPHLRGIVERWLRLFHVHEVNTHQIPLLMPGFAIPPGALDSAHDIADLLTDDLRDATCELFNVRRDWLEGDTDTIYYTEHFGSRLLEKMVEFRQLHVFPQIIAFKTGKKELYQSHWQKGALLLRAEITMFGEKSIYRYAPVYELHEWDYEKGRRLAKETLYAARMLQYDFWGYNCDKKLLAPMREGKIFPAEVMAQARARWHPDDYVYQPDESHVAKEPEELQWILEQMRKDGTMERILKAREQIKLRSEIVRPPASIFTPEKKD